MRNIRTNPDGYTLDGYVAPREGFWDAMEFTYRLCTHGERVAYEEAVKQAQGSKKSAVMCQAIARHIKSWNEVDEKGAEVPVTEHAVSLVKNSYLIDKLWNIITGWELPDSKSDRASSANDDAGALIDSMLESTPPGVLLVERAEKN